MKTPFFYLIVTISFLVTLPLLAQDGEVPRTRTFPGIENPAFTYAKPDEAGLSTDKLNRLGDEITEWVANGELVGGELLIIKNGKAVFHEAYGWADREKRRPMERNSLFSIKSMSKPFTAMAILMLAEEGKLSLDEPVRRYIPYFPDQKTTIHHLLSETSGSDVTEEIDRYLRNVMDEKHIPGLQVVITRAGDVAYSNNFGFADLNHRVPVTDTTRFRSGSIGKTATALGVALLKRDGMLSFDDALTEYFPDAPPNWREITVRDLLDNTSGLQDPGLGWTEDFTVDAYLEAAYARPVAFAPGEYHVYENVNYALLGLITERVSGVVWQAFQQERIFGPLGMSRTHGVTTRVVVPGGAEGYQWRDGRHVEAAPEFSQSVWDLASGSLWTTARDWTRLLLAYEHEELFDQAFIDGVLLTSRDLNSGYLVNYSFGNWIGEFGGTRTAEHGGGVPGFRTFAALYPDKDLTVMVACNFSECDEREIAHTVVGLFDPNLRVPELTPVEVEDLDRFIGTYYFPSWGEGKFVVEDGKLFHHGNWFRHECRMYSETACTPEGETRFEFVVDDNGEVKGLIYYDSAYDKGWWIEKVNTNQ